MTKGKKRYERGNTHVLETNFIPDILTPRSMSTRKRRRGKAHPIPDGGKFNDCPCIPLARRPLSKSPLSWTGRGALGLEGDGYVIMWPRIRDLNRTPADTEKKSSN